MRNKKVKTAKDVKIDAWTSPRGFTIKPAIVSKTPMLKLAIHNTYDNFDLKSRFFQLLLFSIEPILFMYLCVAVLYFSSLCLKCKR